MRIKSFMQKFARDERGVSALEYAVLAAVIVSMHRIAGPQVAHRRATSETVAAH